MLILSFIKSLLGRRKKSHIVLETPQSARLIPRSEHVVSRSDMSENVLKVLRRFEKEGIEAYLVGGGIRDLLLRHAPKDFDVATRALPEEVKHLFRNCRLIGRRFRLAHIHFGREIVEVATFRAKSAPKHHRHHQAGPGLEQEAVYGSLEEDVWRRDLTINALYYRLRDFALLDFTGGFDDIQNRLVRLIGDPLIRYEEDPVRLLRVIRFAAKLDFTIEEKTAAPLSQLGHLLLQVPPARLFEEVLKLFLSGYGLKAFELLLEYHLFEPLFPQLFENGKIPPQQLDFLKIAFSNTDERILAEKPVTPAFLFAVLLWHPLLVRMESLQKTGLPSLIALEQAMHEVGVEQSRLLAIPKRLRLVMREIWLLQMRFPRRQGSKAARIFTHPRFRAAYDFLLLRSQIGEVDPALAQWWTDYQMVSPEEQEKMVAALPKESSRRKPRQKKKPL